MGLNRLNLLYNTATGDPGDPLYFPLNAVRWRTPPRDLAALVTDSAPDRFAARLYHFGAGERRLGAELLLLKPGAYRFALTETVSGKPMQSGDFKVSANARTLALRLPPQIPCSLRIEPAGAAR